MKVELNWMDERVVNYLKSRNPQKRQDIIGTVLDSIENMNEKQELMESLLPEGTHIHGNPKRKERKGESKSGE